ncbi:PEGA domain-containing protein [Methanofollis formosanus]|uniref:PEGA domain-containing protein n=1 Tax=Methanofollis formosanus TaxID=299308 RepID=A0A8G1EGK8_9EURY|nr:PEGA domain-containing protein [Methanofollis formosanus]QYZ79274.1 PEGA domain-containing protein [Methanofollis formosanus]
MERKYTIFLVVMLFAGMVTFASAATGDTGLIGGDKGYFAVHCNVDGAKVYFDDDLKGEIKDGRLLVEVYTTATPYKTISVEADGYQTHTAPILEYPGKGETVDLTVTLQPALIGGDKGAYLVKCNVDGAKVYFDSDFKGEVKDGELLVEVYTTGTPYKMISVEADGYETYTAPIETYPAKGETVELDVTLEQAPIGGDMGAFLVKCNVDGAAVFFDEDLKGEIKNGELLVRVYTTATPYKTITVEAPGYQAAIVQIQQRPAQGETVEVAVALTPVPTPTQTQTPLSLFPVLGALGLCSALFLLNRKN